jgi:aryl-alcohol dehydrogenase
VGAPQLDASLEVPIIPFIARGITMVGINQGEVVVQQSIVALIELLMAHRFEFDSLITQYPFGQINQAATDSKTGATIKAVLTF